MRVRALALARALNPMIYFHIDEAKITPLPISSNRREQPSFLPEIAYGKTERWIGEILYINP